MLMAVPGGGVLVQHGHEHPDWTVWAVGLPVGVIVVAVCCWLLWLALHPGS